MWVNRIFNLFFFNSTFSYTYTLKLFVTKKRQEITYNLQKKKSKEKKRK